MEEYATKNEINLSEIGSSLESCQVVKSEYCATCAFAVYGDDCIKYQNRAAADQLISLAQLNIKLFKELKQLRGDLSVPGNASRWIPTVEPDLPKEFVSVLVCIPSDSPLPTVKEAYLADDKWVTKHGYYPKEKVTHWQPMPKGVEDKT